MRPFHSQGQVPEWKLAVISFLLNMKAHGLNIDLVDTGVRKKVGAQFYYLHQCRPLHNKESIL